MSQPAQVDHIRHPFVFRDDDSYVIGGWDNFLIDDASLQTAKQWLRQQPEVGGVILTEPDSRSLLSEAFNAAWMKLPQRLASLAVRPHLGTSLVARSTANVRCAIELHSGAPLTLWRFLVDVTKRGEIIKPLASGPQCLTETNVAAQQNPQESSLPELLASPPIHDLDWLLTEISLARPKDLCGEVASPADASAILAGLWLLHGDADRSHRVSQSIEDEGRNRCGNYWHGIMHRQEPDYGNAKYWFRRVGRHPVFTELAQRAHRLIGEHNGDSAQRWRAKLGLPDGWDPFVFVDWCEAVGNEAHSPLGQLAQKIQFVEMQLLLLATFQDAVRRNR